MFIYSFRDKDGIYFGLFQSFSEADAASNLKRMRERYPEWGIDLYKVGFFAIDSGSIEPLPEPVKIEIKEDSDNE